MKSHKKTIQMECVNVFFPQIFLKIKILVGLFDFWISAEFIMEIMFAGEKSFGLMSSIAWLRSEDEFLG